MQTEQEFLKTYDINAYERPSVTADVVTLALRSAEGPSTYRKDEKRQLSILLIKRGGHPYKGHWALPGGFLQKDETIEECAIRETREETGITPAALMPIGIFSRPGRDPRGWIISSAYVSILAADDVKEKGGDDADEAEWFSIGFDRTGDDLYKLTLKHRDTTIEALLEETGSRFDQATFALRSENVLAFDHACIIASALASLRGRTRDPEILFDFLPETFTINEIQQVQEAISFASVLPANFRRKIAGYITETDRQTQGAGHRPARLYRRKDA